MAERLNVFLKRTFVGVLSVENHHLYFNYDENFCKSADAQALSVSLPLPPETYSSEEVETFFSGLLPDEDIRRKLSRHFHVSETNTFGLLKEIGAECAGAISVLPDGCLPGDDIAPVYTVLSEDEAYNLLMNLKRNPLGIDANGHFRISGSGAQDKLIARVENGKVLIPRNNTPSTHIIKPDIDGIENSAFNEFFCMRLAKEMGLPVSEVELLKLKDKTFFVTERYDRLYSADKKIIRLHQEDFCQALHCNPKIKYENEGGPTITQCFYCVKQNSSQPAKDQFIFIDALLFNFLIGNSDAHGKNFSLLYKNKQTMFAPLYDLMSTIACFRKAEWRKIKMAMKIDGEYLFSHIFMDKFGDLAESLGLKRDIFKKEFEKNFSDIVEKAVSLAEKFNQNSQTASPIYQNIVDVIKKNYSQLL